jgi:hypothetical protein
MEVMIYPSPTSPPISPFIFSFITNKKFEGDSSLSILLYIMRTQDQHKECCGFPITAFIVYKGKNTNAKEVGTQRPTNMYIDKYKNDPSMTQVGEDFESDDEYKVITVQSGDKWRKLRVIRT